MTFSYDQVRHAICQMNDPGANTKKVHFFKADQSYEIVAAYITCSDAQGAGSAGAFKLCIYGTAGDAVVSGGTVGTKGGTASNVRMAAATPYAYTITEGTMSANQWLVVEYTEVGDWVEKNVVIDVWLRPGISAA